ncbi:MAG: hypothetical protein ACRED4_09515 [Brevundimonas sp.]
MTSRADLTELIEEAVADLGASGPKIADRIIGIAYPETTEAAKKEGCETYLRRGLISHVSRYLRRSGAAPAQVDMSEVAPGFRPIAQRLKSAAYYVPSVEEYVTIGSLIGHPDRLNEARAFMRTKGVECLAEARTLDLLYEAVAHSDADHPVAA